MELGQKGKGRTFKLYRDVPKCYKATAADTVLLATQNPKNAKMRNNSELA